MKRVAVLGSTGSIGTQTLDVIRANSDRLKVTSLVAFSNSKKLAEQAAEFLPQYTGLISRDESCLLSVVQDCDVAVVATRGIVALEAVRWCLQHGIDVALANKETLVCGGKLFSDEQIRQHVLPVDSEHAAIRQCLCCGNVAPNKILLTASGGPFRGFSAEQLRTVTPEQALKHPNWSMGSKITIDSATMMNKSLEVLEASRLFFVPTDRVKIVVHPQSVVHSMVSFEDGSIMAQLACPDMRLPILQALLPNGQSVVKRLNFDEALSLHFEPCDFEKFPCARLGYEVDKLPPLAATVMNAANDVCVDAFLARRLHFCDFYSTICSVLQALYNDYSHCDLSVENIKSFDKLARSVASKLVYGE